MIRARADPDYKPPPPPQPRLGPGLWREGLPSAGQLGIQAPVRRGDVTALLDDLVGRGFVLLLRDQAELLALTLNDRRVLIAHDIKVVHLGDDGVDDVQGAYRKWFDELGAVAVLIRPDFYVYASARDSCELESILLALHQGLTSPEVAPPIGN